MTGYGPAPDAAERVATGSRPRVERGRPQWGWFALFGVNVGIHQFGWQFTDTIGSSIGLAITLGLVFRTRLAWALGVLAGAALFAVLFWAPPGGWHWRFAGLLAAAGLVLMLLARAWRRRGARWAHLLAAGPLTPIPAAVDETGYWEPGDREFVNGWAVLPGGVRTRFSIRRCPQELYRSIRDTRTVWVVGEPRLDEVALGLPEAPIFAEATFSAKRRHLAYAVSGG
jgi:hypothetical protein